MELKPGYKQTEVGVIPDDWQVVKVGDISQVGRGRVISHREISASRYASYPVYSSQTTNDGTMGYINTYDFEGEYITWTTDGVNAGTVFYRDGRFNCTNVCGIMKPHSQNAMFLSKVLNTLTSRYVSRNLANPKLMNDVFKQILVPLPPLPEQRAIAAAFSDTDALLSSLDRLLAKKRDIKQAVMQQLLTGKQRLPGFSRGWEVKQLGDVAEIRKGQLITETDAVDGSVPVIAGGKKPAYFHNKANRNGKTITVSGSGANAGYIAFHNRPIFASDCSTISEGTGYSVEFVFYQLQLNQNAIYKAQIGGAQPHIHPTDLRPIEIGCPSHEEQTAIADLLSDMDAEIDALQQRRDKTRAVKQGMMQELLTGRTRLV